MLLGLNPPSSSARASLPSQVASSFQDARILSVSGLIGAVMFSLNTSQLRATPVAQRASGFTLIEMLVATALVVLMMTIFAEVFQMASGSMVLQRTIAENDQQVRTFVTVMRADLQKRTFRKLIPYFPREDFNDQGESFNGRDGYFYVSSNDPNNASDTVLQMTVDASIKTELADDTPYYGKATILGPAATFRSNPNQPESDDGQIVPNGAASSSAAEVCYFVRNGTLYRRVVLLRQPLSVVGNSSSASSDTIQPKTSASPSIQYFDPNNTAPLLYTGNYWNDFDFAAYRDLSFTPPRLQILGIDTNASVLDNQRSATTDNPLGRSRRRFGFDQTTGLSREFFGASNELFLGRFTQQETSSAGFLFPFALSTVAPGGNPFATGANLPDANSDGIPDGFDTGSRVGEDILLTHVHSFEVEPFDERLQSFAAIGHSLTNTATGLAGDFHIGRLLNSGYFAPGMGQTAGRVFDTWHPLYDQDGSPPIDQLPANNLAAMTQDRPPYRPMVWDPMGVSAPMPTNTGSGPQWVPGVNYVPGDVVFPPTEDTNYNGMLDAGEDTDATTFKGYAFISTPLPNGSGDNLIDVRQTIDRPVLPLGRVYYYICRRAAVPNPSNMNTVPAASTSYADQPAWTSNANRLFGHNNNPERDFMPLWEAIPNLKPVRAVRITVRFLHRGSNKLRQFTLVHSLRD